MDSSIPPQVASPSGAIGIAADGTLVIEDGRERITVELPSAALASLVAAGLEVLVQRDRALAETLLRDMAATCAAALALHDGAKDAIKH